VSSLAIKAGLGAASEFCRAAPQAARNIGNGLRFRGWLSLMQRFATMAPESVTAVLRRMDGLLAELNVAQLEQWILTGVRQAGVDRARRKAFFEEEMPEALADADCGENGGFFARERALRAWLAAMFGVRPIVRQAPRGRPDGGGRRVSFGEGFIRMPARFPGFSGAQADALYRAALAHVGAHMVHTGTRFEVGALKPLQIACVSLIEDARVEALAAAEMPGLRRLWAQFHVAEPSGALTATSRFARLSRALLDPEFEDIDGWVRKGRDLFHAASDRWDDPALSRAIGNVLGNDLGQLRIQFNPTGYIVQPAYRDDNSGLWTFSDAPDPEECTDILVEAVRISRSETPAEADRTRQESPDRDGETRVRPVAPDAADTGIAVARYPEYDYEARVERADWTTVLDCPLPSGSPDYLSAALQRHADLVERLAAMVSAARVGRVERRRRQPEGETLDIDAAIAAMAALRAGEMPEIGLYQTMARGRRDLAVSVLLDVSASTADPVGDVGTPLIELLRDATVVLGQAMEGLGDPFSIAAFASDGREAVRYLQIKPFGAPLDATVGAALAGLTPAFSTRLGAALRHAGASLARQASHRRLVLLLTDGEPSDIDCPDPRYLVEDARRAVLGLEGQGIDVFCVGLGKTNIEIEERIFGRRRTVQISSVADLPEKLAILYLRLTA
jgi:hypothetical protein